jgi:hypothetical protein
VWLRAVLACALSAVLLGLLMLIGQTDALTGWFALLGAISVLWLIFGPIWATVARSGRTAAG